MEVSRAVHAGSEDEGGAAPELSESRAPTDDTYRSHFAAWLGGMGEEARQLAFLLEREEASAPLRRLAADSLNQLLHAADMLPEGTEALGYLETLFAFRLLAAEVSEAAYAAPRLPKPKPKLEPARVTGPAEVQAAKAVEPSEVEPVGVEVADAAEAERSGPEADAEHGEAEPGLGEATEADLFAGEALQAVAAEVAGVDGERAAVELPAGEPEPSLEESLEAELSDDESLTAESLRAESPNAAQPEQESAEHEPAQVAVAAEAAPEQEWEEPEPAQASDQSYAIARRLAPQAALVRAFLGADDAERLRRLVQEQRSRASRGRSSKEVLLQSEARAAAASDARDWAELYEAPAFGSMQHDLLRLRTFMKTRVRRGAS